jgi:metal-sulfur cluster biosynthetic enzyme
MFSSRHPPALLRCARTALENSSRRRNPSLGALAYRNSSFQPRHWSAIAQYDDVASRNRHGLRTIHTLPGVSPRDMADLEDRLWSVVGSKVKDPELLIDIKSLGWMNRRLAVSEDGTIQILLRLPTLLHPSLEELKTLVQKAAEKEVSSWAKEKGTETKRKVNVEAIASKPTPWLVKNVEDQKEFESRHGPGLANVAHCLAVYSCKVKNPRRQTVIRVGKD